jgi:hypothetical protein
MVAIDDAYGDVAVCDTAAIQGHHCDALSI